MTPPTVAVQTRNEPSNPPIQDPANMPTLESESDAVTVETRFGQMEFNQNSMVTMPRGLLGYANYREFGLAAMPDPKLGQFMVLQSLTDAELSFVVAPLNPDGETIELSDISDACETLSIDPIKSATLLVVSTRRIGNVTQISVNLRAPIIVDTQAQQAWQHVLPNSRYPVRQVIASANHDED
ncbi:MAG: hypothetical protein GKS01_06195 [Alphaproteobacteria bacterium]|nr:hypothetical protein [Alphaproteobacteria bacterium]